MRSAGSATKRPSDPHGYRYDGRKTPISTRMERTTVTAAGSKAEEEDLPRSIVLDTWARIGYYVQVGSPSRTGLVRMHLVPGRE